MKRRLVLLAGLAATALLAACGNDIQIGPEPSGSSHHTSSGPTMGGTGGATSSGSTSSGAGGAIGSSSSSGGPAQGKLVTAETDIGQYQSFTVTATADNTPQKLIDGPFFVTDVVASWGNGGPSLTTVTGGDCSVAADQHTLVLATSEGPPFKGQMHGIRLPILPGRTLCLNNGSSPKVTVMGFRPY